MFIITDVKSIQAIQLIIYFSQENFKTALLLENAILHS